MRLLGAIFAGGAARRFGADKALALIDGQPMIAHVATRLATQCMAVCVVGRDWPGLIRVDDAPTPGLGPLGALAGALCYAREHGFDAVLSSGCDLPDLPLDLAERLSPAPAFVEGQQLLGLWPVASAGDLIAYLDAGGDRAIRGWIARCQARAVALANTPANINTPADLTAFTQRT